MPHPISGLTAHFAQPGRAACKGGICREVLSSTNAREDFVAQRRQAEENMEVLKPSGLALGFCPTGSKTLSCEHDAQRKRKRHKNPQPPVAGLATCPVLLGRWLGRRKLQAGINNCQRLANNIQAVLLGRWYGLQQLQNP